MLSVLHIENIAVIESADIEFRSGLNVLTGETGAGKSIIIDSLCALMGERTSRDIIRSGEKSAVVTGIFHNPGSEVIDALAALGYSLEEDGCLYITRQVFADGRNSCRINTRPAPLSALRDLGKLLIVTHGQNDSRSLLDTTAHITLLDTYAGISGKVMNEYSAALEKLKSIRARQKALVSKLSDRERTLESLRFCINEIESCAIQINEDEEIEERLKIVKSSEKLVSALESARTALVPEDCPGVASSLESAAGFLAGIAELLGGDLPETVKELYNASYAARDAAERASELIAAHAYSEQELDRLEQRRAQLMQLKRKYGGTLESVFETLDSAKLQEEELLHTDRLSDELDSEYRAQYEKTFELAANISRLRKEAGERLSEAVNAELSYLKMEGARFRVSVLPRERSGKVILGSDGIDVIEFFITANRGEQERPLAKSASGGELSRIMLALNTVSAASEVNTLVFDEIDTGVSGIAASRVADRLARLARGRQVLCVTHLSQLAAMADTHFRISKTSRDGRTYTSVSELDTMGRAGEIARINGGENYSDVTVKAALEQLKAADDSKSKM